MNSNNLIFALIIAVLLGGWLLRIAFRRMSQSSRRSLSPARAATVQPARKQRVTDDRPFSPDAIPPQLDKVSLMLHNEAEGVWVWLFRENHPHKDYIGMSGDGVYNAYESALWYCRTGDPQFADARFTGVLEQLEQVGWRITSRLHDRPKARLYHLVRG